MKVFIVEDEAIIARRLKKMLHAIDGELQIRCFDNVDDARDAFATSTLDVLFLDLNLNSHDGFELLTDITASSFQTIVVSAHTEKAIEAFEYGVLDFVRKPFCEARLREALGRVRGEGGQSSVDRRRLKFVGVRRPGRVDLVPIDEILVVRASGNYSKLVEMAGKTHLHNKTLDRLLAVLPSNFVRTHRSYAVNIEHARCIYSHTGSRYELELTNGTRVPIGRTRIKEVQARYLHSVDDRPETKTALG